MSGSNSEYVGGASDRLERQLELALKNDPNYEGDFAFGTIMHSAPNPGLEINALGVLGLPLSLRDVDSIKSIASRASFGHGEKTVLDSTVRDPWEISASQISFKNSTWASFLDSVVDTVWKGLGVAPITVRPTCELYKLLLYETGSQYVLIVPIVILTSVVLANCRSSVFFPIRSKFSRVYKLLEEKLTY